MTITTSGNDEAVVVSVATLERAVRSLLLLLVVVDAIRGLYYDGKTRRWAHGRIGMAGEVRLSDRVGASEDMR